MVGTVNGNQRLSEGFYIGHWQVQLQAGLISHNGETRRLEPKVMAVLEVLARADGAAVSRPDIMDAVWPNQDVSDDVLTSTVSSLRRILGDDRRENRFIETLPKRGYRLVVEIQFEDAPPSANSPAAQYSVKSEEVTNSRVWIRRSMMTVIALVVLGVLLWATNQTSVPQNISDDPSIAVLPLDVFSDDPEMEHFTSGLEEELIHQLARQTNLRVIARTSSFRFGDQSLGIREISEILGVRHVIEGSVRDSTDGIRITIQLIDASSDSHLWSHVFDVEKNRLVAVQEEVGLAVSRMISGQQVVASYSQQPRHPVPDSAYRLFLLGQAHMRVETAESYRTASGYFLDAVRISPDYALAYSRLAATFMLLYQYDGDSLEQAGKQARSALNRALELDPDQPEALATMGLMYTYEKDYVKAETYFKAALERQANLRFALHNYGFMLWSESRFEEALVPLNQALKIDPLSGVTNFLVGDSLVGVGAFAEARAHYKKCQELIPLYYSCPGGYASLQLLASELDSAEETLAHAGTLVPEDDFWQLVGEAELAFRREDFTTAEDFLQRAGPKNPRNYVLLRLKLLNNLAMGQLPVFIDELQELLANYPSDRDVRLIAAFSYYFSDECSKAIEIYEEELEHADAFLFDVWDLGFGLTHATSLAHCYEESGNTEEKNRLLDLISEYLSSAPSSLPAGKLVLQTKYSYLVNEKDEVRNYAKKLEREDWHLSWLASHDPLLLREQATTSGPLTIEGSGSEY